MSRTEVTDADEGKPVVDADGEQIGLVSAVRDDTVHVTVDAEISDAIRSKLGWDDEEQDDYPLHTNRIDRVTDVEIRLNEGS